MEETDNDPRKGRPPLVGHLGGRANVLELFRLLDQGIDDVPLATSPQLVAAADSARDSVAKVAMANMKVWVDSAAGVSVPAHVGDTTAANDPGRPVTTTFADGSVAPATASDLPTVALLGVLVCAIGAALLANRPRS